VFDESSIVAPQFIVVDCSPVVVTLDPLPRFELPNAYTDNNPNVAALDNTPLFM
jgi:hypothetical protein